MALYSLLKLVALCALFHEAAAFAPLPPSACKEGDFCGQVKNSTALSGDKKWYVFKDADYAGDYDIVLTVSPLGGYDGAFIDAAKRMAEDKGNNIIVVRMGLPQLGSRRFPIHRSDSQLGFPT